MYLRSLPQNLNSFAELLLLPLQTVDRGGTAHGRVGISMFHSTPFFYDGARKLQAHGFSLGEAGAHPHLHCCRATISVSCFKQSCQAGTPCNFIRA